MPLVILVIGISLWRTTLGDIAQFKGLGGKERWSFARGTIELPADQMGIQLPPLMAGIEGIRACLNITGGRWVLDFSAGRRNVYLGPFNSKALALRCEADLRRLLPRWFTQPPGTAILDGVDRQLSPNGLNIPPEPIIALAAISNGDGEILLELRRQPGRRPLIRFFMFWLSGWLAFEILIIWLLLRGFAGVSPHRPHLTRFEAWALVPFELAWIGIGTGCVFVVTLGLKHKEVWKFIGNAIIAARSYHYYLKRRLPIDQTVQVRFGPFAGPPSVDFISGGILLHLGPFQTWELAGEALGDVERQFPHWHWPRSEHLNS